MVLMVSYVPVLLRLAQYRKIILFHMSKAAMINMKYIRALCIVICVVVRDSTIIACLFAGFTMYNKARNYLCVRYQWYRLPSVAVIVVAILVAVDAVHIQTTFGHFEYWKVMPEHIFVLLVLLSLSFPLINEPRTNFVWFYLLFVISFYYYYLSWRPMNESNRNERKKKQIDCDA